MEKNKGARGAGPGRGKKAVAARDRLLDTTPTLADMGVSKSQSSWQIVRGEISEEEGKTRVLGKREIGIVGGKAGPGRGKKTDCDTSRFPSYGTTEYWKGTHQKTINVDNIHDDPRADAGGGGAADGAQRSARRT